MVKDGAEVFAEWRRLSAAGLNNRAAAAALGMSEAALLSTGCGNMATRLAPEPRAFLEAARALGPAKYVVRNDYAVLERPGEIGGLEQSGGELSAVGASFTLRLSASRVASAFALEEPGASGIKRSLQLFDGEGTTLVKIVFRSESVAAPFRALAAQLRLDSQAAPEHVVRPDAAAPPSRTAPARDQALAEFLKRATELATEIRFTVRNAGACLEAASTIRRVRRSSRAPWINVLDPDLDLHLYEARINAFTLEPGTDGRRRVHWLADDGSVALSTELPAPFADWVLASSRGEGRSGLRERAVQA